MILLHHPEVELSRILLETLPKGATSLDCVQGVPSGYTGPQPSSYPSVVVDVPAYMQDVPLLDADGSFLGMGQEAVAAHQEAVRMPASWEAVAAFLAYVEARAASNPPE